MKRFLLILLVALLPGITFGQNTPFTRGTGSSVYSPTTMTMMDHEHAERDGLVSREAVMWAFRLFIGREPGSEEEIAFHRQHTSLASLRLAFASTVEFAEYQRRNMPEPYCAPLFLLQKPIESTIPWRFSPPLLSQPDSHLCTNGQLTEYTFFDWCNVMHLAPKTESCGSSATS